MIFRASLLGLATLSAVTCTADAPESTGIAEQDAINQLPGNLNPILNAKTAVTVGAFTQVFGDVSSTGINGSVLFDTSSSQGFGFNVLANTIKISTNAFVGHVFGNDITIDGGVAQRSLGLDPQTLPPVPAVTPSTPGTTNLSVGQNQAKQACPGQYGTISLGINGTLNLNGGVYQVQRLNLADGAHLEPSEPVVILVTGGVVTGVGSQIRPSDQALNPMTAADIRIEVSGAITLGDSTQVRAHLLAPGTRITTGRDVRLNGAAWAKTISWGTGGVVVGEGVFAAQSPQVPPPCNDNNACTTDACVSTGAAAFCRNAPTAAGSSCEDGNLCNGEERCDGAGACLAGKNRDAGTSCPDGDLCNGDETCNGVGTCVPGTPPVVSDGNTCTTDACDPSTGVSHDPVPDGTTCAGTGTCEAGTCSIQAQMLVMINDENGHLERLDPDTLAVTDIGPLGVGYAFGDCAFHAGDETLYMVDGRSARGLFRIDLTTGAATLVGIHGLTDVFALGYHPPTNQLFAVDGNGDLFTLSTATGAATKIGHTPMILTEGLAFDTTRNAFIALTAGAVRFFSLDVATAQATELAQSSFLNDLGMTYDPVIDRFWAVDFSGEIVQFDPNQGFARTRDAFIGSRHTCIASVPVP